MPPFILISPASRGLSLAFVRHFLRTTTLPVFGTYRPSPPGSREQRTRASIHQDILRSFAEDDIAVDPERLHVLPLDLLSEDSIASAADALARTLRSFDPAAPSHLRLACFAGGVLHPERQPADLDLAHIEETFRTNVVAHLLLVKHFARFLQPPPGPAAPEPALARWVHVSARVGSVSDNRLGGWYSYRASKAALNQVVRTFDLHLQAKRVPAICVGVHPGTVRTDLSKAFWNSVPPEQLFEPEDAAAKLVDVIGKLGQAQRGRVWDWKGEEMLP